MPWYPEFVQEWGKANVLEHRCVDGVVKQQRTKFMCDNGKTRIYSVRVVKNCACQQQTRRHGHGLSHHKTPSPLQQQLFTRRRRRRHHLKESAATEGIKRALEAVERLTIERWRTWAGRRKTSGILINWPRLYSLHVRARGCTWIRDRACSKCRPNNFLEQTDLDVRRNIQLAISAFGFTINAASWFAWTFRTLSIRHFQFRYFRPVCFPNNNYLWHDCVCCRFVKITEIPASMSWMLRNDLTDSYRTVNVAELKVVRQISMSKVDWRSFSRQLVQPNLYI